ncbi:sigma-70 family RNA polymerase sigma factor [Planctomicrobium sp.]|jgi:RNA polymerase sigma-70 factor, ECF subfamily|nr:sigma-70 family RNA polymerase sigma factor [Planctomicrobium sp.]MBT5017742.1 sigma-70 family RNA polymerase sigma factor [Planctomicrobium sp.]MDB4742937.1 sigma-70 family RNA polymerase sigma factor [Planctomicrobium sp.]
MNTKEQNPADSITPPGEEFIQLFTQAQRVLYLFILSQVGKVQAAEEILQETNLVIWSKSSSFEMGSSFIAWVRQIAVYEVLKWKQKRSREKLTFSGEFMNTIAERFSETPEQIELRQLALENCLKKLTDQDRELIEKRYQPGMNGKSVASDLGRPPNSVYQSLGRIRKVLQDCVERSLALEN